MKVSTLFRVACSPVARIWGGVGDLVIPADIVETAPALYLGGGELVNVPDFEQLINGVAARLDITVSGVAPAALALAVEEAASVRGARVHIGCAYFNDDWQLDEVEWLGVFRADALTTSNKSSVDGRSRSITLSLGSEDTDRNRAPVAIWSDADQRRRSPTDRFFDHIAGIVAGTSRRFGPVGD